MSVYYFAYGSCMDEKDFKRTVPEFTTLGGAILQNYRLAFTLYGQSRAGGVADVVQSAGSEVQGVLYKFPEKHLPALDQREGVDNGMYERMEVDVLCKGQKVQAYTYQVLNKADAEIPPSSYYLSLMLKGMNKFATVSYRQQFETRVKEKFGVVVDPNLATTASAQERRKFKRVNLKIPVKIGAHQWTGDGSFQGQEFEALLDDISESGVKLRSRTPFSKDMFLRIMFPQHDGLSPIVVRIIRCDSENGIYTYGCLVAGISLADFRNLQAYIRNRMSKKKKS